jgi:hypothetical protein
MQGQASNERVSDRGIRNMTIPLKQWIDIGERPRHVAPLMWRTYPMSPFTVGEARDLAQENKIIMMHRHEPDRVVMQVWIPGTVKSIYGRE